MRHPFGRYLRQHHIGLLALFIAIGGTSYAAVALPSNSVGTTQIKPGAIRGSDLASNAITSLKVKNGSLLSSDFKPGQLKGSRGDSGPAGPQGLKGADGSAGLQGLKGADGSAGPQGLKGADGSPGANGTSGAQGPIGPSDAWAITQTGNANGVTLPVGTFVLTGDVYFNSGIAMRCTAWHQTGVGGASGKISFASTAVATEWTLPVAAAFVMTSPGKAWVDCTGGGTGSIVPNVAVIKVGTLN